MVAFSDFLGVGNDGAFSWLAADEARRELHFYGSSFKFEIV